MKPIFAVIPSYNKLLTLEQTVKSLFDTGAMEFIELNIVDDYSNKETRDYLRDLKQVHPEIHIYFFNEWIPGVAKPLNFGLCRRNSSQYWMSMDNDVVFTDTSWYLKLLDLFRNNYQVGVIALKPPMADYYKEKFPQHDRLPIELTTTLPNLCTMISHDVLNDIGYYYDDYPWTGFDWDIAMRASKAGYITGLYNTSRVNPNDYIDVIDLGRPQYFDNLGLAQYFPNEPDKFIRSMDVHYPEVAEFLIDAEDKSTQILHYRVPLIDCGEINYEDTCMKNFTNFEVLQ